MTCAKYISCWDGLNPHIHVYTQLSTLNKQSWAWWCKLLMLEGRQSQTDLYKFKANMA